MFRGEKCYTQHLQPGSHGKNTVCEAITYCTQCLKTVKSDRKHTCGEQRKIFKKIFVIAHAGGLYDTQFILHHIMTKTYLKPELITQGTKLLLLSVENVKFIASLNYFPMPLSKLPKAFGLQGLKKGYFPHLFNKNENWNYVGPLPALEYYDPDNFKYTPILDDSKDERQKLIDWHTKLSKQQYVFDFQNEIVDYCISDVNVLQQACLKFRQIMLNEGNVDPFTEAITLLGACNKIFRRNFLKPETIGIMPKASGYPTDCITETGKVRYVAEYLEKEGVVLCPEEIEVNPGGRQIGQRENQAKTSIVKDPDEFFDILSRPFLEVNNIYPVNDETLIVNWQYKYESYQVLPSVSVTLAAYTTAQARLRLYYFLEQLGERVLYFDTDSIVYISRPGAYDVPLGSCLRDLTDELEEYGPNSYISHFASGGPKLYGYRVQSTNYHKHLDIIKVKGITLNYRTINQVNFEVLRDMILHEASGQRYVITKNILRTPDHSVVTRAITKIFRPNFSKRKRIDDYDSVPHGYKILKTKE
nr:unnamed protein product [Callosobruchus analis]